MTSKPTPRPTKSPIPSVTVPEFTGNYVELQFPVWNDNDIKTLDMPDFLKPKPQESERRNSTFAEPLEPEHFKDPELVPVPASIEPTEWVPQSELFSDAVVTLYNSSNRSSNFMSASKHLFMSEFVRTFICSIHILERLSLTMPWPIEGASETYYPNTQNEPWRPWHHVYGLGTAGKGTTHRPTLNPYGRYYVRLYWMGCWRKITVDDTLPIDNALHILLPTVEEGPAPEKLSKINSSLTKLIPREVSGKRTAKSSMRLPSKRRDIELWPFLLCKALFKVASLTWTETEELVDFNIITTLTGWVVQKVCTLGQTPDDVWEICMSYSKKYQWPEEQEQQEPKVVKNEKVEKKGKGKGKDDSTSKSTKETKNKRKASSIKGNTELQDITPSFVVGSFKDMRHLLNEEVPNISPCWSHHFLIHETRNIPFTKPDESAYDLALWKKFRWVEWAKKHKIFVETDFRDIKFIKMISTFKKVNEFLKYEQRSRMTIDLKNIVRTTQDYLKEKRENTPGSDKMRKRISRMAEKKKSTSLNSQASEKVIFLEPDPSFWMDFNKLFDYIDYLYIFMRPSLFSKIFKVTNIKELEHPMGQARTQSPPSGYNSLITIPWQNTLKHSRNEPLYLFMETLESTYLIVNVNQSGNEPLLHVASEKSSISSLSDQENKANTRSCTHVITEMFDWMNRKIGCNDLGISTYGSKTIIVSLCPGRHILRLWIRCLNSFMMFIICNEPMQIGSFEVINGAMLNESQSLIKTCYDVGDKFGQLIAAFGTPEYRKCLLDFYNSYMPDVPEKKKFFRVHQEFFEQLLIILKEKYGPIVNKYLSALRCLFVNTKYGFPLIERNSSQNELESEVNTHIYAFSGSSSNSYSSISSYTEALERIKRMEGSACVIQAFFKKIYVKKLLSYHSEAHPKHEQILETLKTLYKDILNVQVRVLTFSTIFRNLFFYTDVLDPIKMSDHINVRVYADFYNVVLNHTLTGTLQVYFPGWNLIGRYVFQINSCVGEVIKIYVFCHVDEIFLRVFDNDTYKEIITYSNFTGVHTYLPNLKGYTVLVYGWLSSAMLLKWKLCFITVKKGPHIMIDLGDRKIERYFLTDIYKPNAVHQICKCKIAFNTTTSATFRFTCSLKTARIKLIYRDHKGNICNEIIGIGSVIMPLVDFVVPFTKISHQIRKSVLNKKKRRSSDTILHRVTMVRSQSIQNNPDEKETSLVTYYNTLEAYVLDDSWPLSKFEWKQVDTVKSGKLTINPVDNTFVTSKGYPRRLSECKTSLNFDLLPKPYWCLQLFAEEGSLISIFPDLKREETTRIYKELWNMDPDRYEFARNLRTEYLIANYGTSDASVSVCSDDSDITNKSVYLTRPGKLSKVMLDFSTYSNRELGRINSTRIKCIEEAIQDQFDMETLLDNFEDRFAQFAECCAEMVDNKTYRNVNSENWFLNRKQESDQKLSYSYKFREEFMKTTSPAQGVKKGSATKKGKKKSKI